MKSAIAAAMLALAAGGCAYAPAPPRTAGSTQGLPPPLVRPPAEAAYQLVAANPDAARIIRGLEARGLRPVPDDVSAVDQLASAPGYVWRVGPDWLHIHSYRSRPPAEAAAQGFVMQMAARSQIIDWVRTPRLFQCRSAVALYLGDSPQALTVLTYLCGPPVWQKGAP